MTESSFACPRTAPTIKGWAADPGLHGRAMGKHAKQFGLKKLNYKLLVEKHLPHLARKKEFSSLGMGNGSIARN